MLDIIILPLGIIAIICIFVLLHKLLKLELLLAIIGSFLVTVAIITVSSWLNWQGLDVLVMHFAVYVLTIYILSITTGNRENKKDGRKWHWGPVAIISFFAIIIVVDTGFIIISTKGLDSDLARLLLPAPRKNIEIESRFPGTVSHDFREKEIQFNTYQNQRLKQQQRGWQVKIGWEKDAVAKKNNTLLLKLVKENEVNIHGAKIYGKLLRPGNPRLDTEFAMQENRAGLYTAKISLTEPGHWDVIINIQSGNDFHEVRMSTYVSKADDTATNR